MPDYKQVQDIARASLMADFFSVRIEEEGLYDDLKKMLEAIQFPTPVPAMDRIKAVAARAENAQAFIDGVKETDDFTTLRDVLMKVKFG